MAAQLQAGKHSSVSHSTLTGGFECMAKGLAGLGVNCLPDRVGNAKMSPS